MWSVSLVCDIKVLFIRMSVFRETLFLCSKVWRHTWLYARRLLHSADLYFRGQRIISLLIFCFLFYRCQLCKPKADAMINPARKWVRETRHYVCEWCVSGDGVGLQTPSEALLGYLFFFFFFFFLRQSPCYIKAAAPCWKQSHLVFYNRRSFTDTLAFGHTLALSLFFTHTHTHRDKDLFLQTKTLFHQFSQGIDF